MASELIHSCPKFVQPQVLGWVVAVAIAPLGEPGLPAPKCPAGWWAPSHSNILPTLSSAYALTHIVLTDSAGFLS